MQVTPYSDLFADIARSVPSPLEQISLPDSQAHGVEVWGKRDELIHPIISGNKWRKLQGTDFSKCKHVISIGGGYSNHLHALGYLCAKMNMPFTALVRGHYQTAMTPMLNDLVSWKTNIEFIDRAT